MRWSPLLVVAAILAACGGQPPPAASTPGPSGSDAPADSAGTTGAPAPGSSSASSTPAPGGDPTASKPSIESQREPFMQGCMKKVQSPDYCDCGFEQFRQIFKDADLSQPNPADDARFEKLRQATMTNCASKVPEDLVKSGFLTSCAGGDSRKDAYCKCAWTSLRKSLAPVDFLGDFQGARFDDAKKALVGVCKGKFPEEVAKTEFIGACSKGNDAASAQCTCIWKKLRGKYSTEEIAAGLADIKATPGVDKCQPK